MTDDEPPELAFYCPECAEREFLSHRDEAEFVELSREDFEAELRKRGVLDGQLDPALLDKATILFWPASGAWLLKPREEPGREGEPPDVEASSIIGLRKAS